MLNKIALRTDPCGTTLGNAGHELYLNLCSLLMITKVTLYYLSGILIKAICI